MRIVDKIAQRMHDAFTAKLAADFKSRFGIEVESSWSIFAGALVTVRSDGEPLTLVQGAFIAGYETAWLACDQLVRA